MLTTVSPLDNTYIKALLPIYARRAGKPVVPYTDALYQKLSEGTFEAKNKWEYQNNKVKELYRNDS